MVYFHVHEAPRGVKFVELDSRVGVAGGQRRGKGVLLFNPKLETFGGWAAVMAARQCNVLKVPELYT